MPAHTKAAKLHLRVNGCFRHLSRIYDEDEVNSLRKRFNEGEDVRAEVNKILPNVQQSDKKEHRNAHRLGGALNRWYIFLETGE